MANKKGKYDSFKQWLIWCNSQSPVTAKTLVSYLRKLEKTLLIQEGSFSEFHVLHDQLNVIDTQSNSYGHETMMNVVESLAAIENFIKGELHAETNKTDTDLDVVNGWRRAFNKYLEFLSDVTTCFNDDDAKKVNDNLRFNPNRRLDEYYEKRLKIFKSGFPYDLLKLPEATNLVEGMLDKIADFIDSIVAPSYCAQVATQFLTTDSIDTAIVGESSGCSWRTWLVEGLCFVDSTEYFCDDYSCYISRRESNFNLERTQPSEESRKCLMAIIELCLRLKDELSQIIFSGNQRVCSLSELARNIQSNHDHQYVYKIIERYKAMLKTQIYEFGHGFRITITDRERHSMY